MSDRDGFRKLAGIGFGPIQTCLFLREARLSGNFGRLAVGLRRADVVRSIRAAGNRFFVNTATRRGVMADEITDIDVRLLPDAADRDSFIADLTDAEEIAVAVSGVDQYETSGPESVNRLLATAIRRKGRGGGPKALIYVAENHRDAARILEQAVFAEIPVPERTHCRTVAQFSNTVISKISMAIRTPEEIAARNLSPASPGLAHAFLAERTARVLIESVDPERTSGCRLPGLSEKKELAPFDQAKLYGQNSIHSACGFFGLVFGRKLMSEVTAISEVQARLLAMSREEIGQVLISRYHDIDPLFTEEGIQRYAEELLERISNPWIPDTCARTGRDPGRKLGWNDRIVGILRGSLDFGLKPEGLGFATLAGLTVWRGSDDVLSELSGLWRAESASGEETERVVRFLAEILPAYRSWKSGILRAM